MEAGFIQSAHSLERKQTEFPAGGRLCFLYCLWTQGYSVNSGWTSWPACLPCGLQTCQALKLKLFFKMLCTYVCVCVLMFTHTCWICFVSLETVWALLMTILTFFLNISIVTTVQPSYFPCRTWDQTQGLLLARQKLYHWAALQPRAGLESRNCANISKHCQGTC